MRRLLARSLCSLVAAALAAAPAVAWSPDSQRAIAADAARLAPPDLARQLARYPRELAKGAAEPFEDRQAEWHFHNEDGSGSLDRALGEEVEAAIGALRAFRSFTEVSRRLGRVAHWAADLSNPLNASGRDAEEGRYFRDYLLYADSARHRFAVVLYENRGALRGKADVDHLAADALARGRELYPRIGMEYRRIGFASGRERFDDRSTAFGVAALAYSHAVTDAARLYRYIWLAAGGADSRTILDKPRDRLLLLDRTAP
jgi:hypothetical protein